MLNLQHSITVEPRDGALRRLAELSFAINAAAALLTPTDARAILNELNAVSRALKRVNCRKSPSRSANAVTTMQGDLLG